MDEAQIIIIFFLAFFGLQGLVVLYGYCCRSDEEAEEDDDDTQLRGTVIRFLDDEAKRQTQRYTSQQLEQYTHNYSRKLGSGGFGTVYKGRLPNGVPIAVKVLKNDLTKQVEEQFMAEVKTIGRTYHLNLVKLYGYCFEPNLKALVYEYMKNGSLDMLLFGRGGGEIQPALNWGKLHNIAVGTAKGIAYLHEECEQKIIHHDIKPGNVLLDANHNPKVGDFGLARLSKPDNTHVVMSGFKGTPGYAAPEVWTSYVSHKCDVYSFGMLLFEIVGRRRNLVRDLSGTSKEWFPRWSYEKLTNNEVVEMMTQCGVEERDREKVERAVMVALWCIQHSPSARPEMGVVVKMLEGVVEIVMPPNPFSYLEETFESRSWSTTISSNMNEIKEYATYPQVLERKIDIDQLKARTED